MVTNIRELGRQEESTGMENYGFQMEVIIRDNSKITSFKARDNTIGKERSDIRANLLIVKCKARDFCNGLMEINIKATFLMIRCMEKDISMTKMELSFLEYGKMGEKTVYLPKPSQTGK